VDTSDKLSFFFLPPRFPNEHQTNTERIDSLADPPGITYPGAAYLVGVMAKTPVLLLHGAIGSNAQFDLLRERLSHHFDVHAPNFPCHGGEPSSGAFSIPGFVDFVKDYIDRHQLNRPVIFGYSMGGYVACYLSLKYPGSVGSIITLATKFYWDEATASAETKMLQPDILEQKVPKFAEALAQTHGAVHWKELLHQTARLLEGLGKQPALKKEDYPAITAPCLLLVGDRDKMVGIEETAAVYRSLPSARFAVLPATPHPIEQVPIDLLVLLITR
jgi:pimeloyl-ACP methyl ester carboxylesterase